jgi:hypothetical protein
MLQIFATAVGELQRTFSDAFNPYRPNFIICGGQDQLAALRRLQGKYNISSRAK